MAKIVVIGSLNMDIVALVPRLPSLGETIIGSQYLNNFGGKGANQACAAAKLGGNVAMLGRVGDDEFGRHMRANLESVGCDVSAVHVTEGRSGVAMILVADSGQNSIVVVPGANERYRRSGLYSDTVHLAGAEYALLQLEIPMDTVIAAAEIAHRRGVKVILDPAPAPAYLPAPLLEHVDILTPNETEAAQLVGRRATHLSVDEARDIVRQLHGLGARTVIVKLGDQGCLLHESKTATLISAPQVEVVDTTAAGDVFNGALAVARTEGASLPDACRFAVTAAALSVTRVGAQESMPFRTELGSDFQQN